MKRVWSVFRYLIHESLAPIAIYYFVVIALMAVGFTFQITYNNVKIGFNGIMLATAIFLFVAGLNTFKSPYLFMQANGITRRCFYRGGVLALAVAAIGMTLADKALYGLLRLVFPPERELAAILYPGGGFIGTMAWTLAFNLLAVFGGWLVTMLYYRLNKMGKVALSLFPAAAVVGLSLLEPLTGCWKAIAAAFRYVMGLAGDSNLYIGALTLLAVSAAVAALSFLLVRRAQLKEQDR